MSKIKEVYIVFDDTPRNDGENILEVFRYKEDVEDYIRVLRENYYVDLRYGRFKVNEGCPLTNNYVLYRKTSGDNNCSLEQVDFPAVLDNVITAQEAAKKSQEIIENCATTELKQIMDDINLAVKMGDRKLSFEGYLSPISKNRLTELGYEVETGNQYNQGWVSIKW